VSKETYKQTYSEAKETKVSVKRDLVWRKKSSTNSDTPYSSDLGAGLFGQLGGDNVVGAHDDSQKHVEHEQHHKHDVQDEVDPDK
jgi:hypothetical protein